MQHQMPKLRYHNLVPVNKICQIWVALATSALSNKLNNWLALSTTCCIDFVADTVEKYSILTWR